MASNSPKRCILSTESANENSQPGRFSRISNSNLFQRPFSALALHRIHELSDIREVSGSSKGGTVRKKHLGLNDGAIDLPPALPRPKHNVTSESLSSEYSVNAGGRFAAPSTPPRGLGSRAPSALSLPLADVPERRSSASFFGHSVETSRNLSLQDFPSWKLPPPSAAGQSIPARGQADSPVRTAMRRDAVSTEALRHSASRTFIRTSPPLDILDNGSSRHPRVEMTVRLPSPLFVGGGTVEGQIALRIDADIFRKAKLKPIYISKLSIDVIGVEEVNDGRRWIFLSLATELFDEQHPPPASLVSSSKSVSEKELLWALKSASVSIPFRLNLPLNLGPPPYLSKQAGIRYLLCPTAVVKIGDKQNVIRQTWNIQMLTVHDPEKALASLPSPLLASDTLSLTTGKGVQNLKVTAGLHRQVWVNGAAIFVDIHIANNTSKAVKRVEVQLEKSTLWYSHAAAGTAEESARHLRLPKKMDNEQIASAVSKKSKEWRGVAAHSSEVRTCDISVPRGHVTISTGQYFEVRYYLNVIVTVGMFKTVAVQLPITLIHINSLDILPNSLAQVAASIEAKRAKTVPVSQESPLYPPYHQGQAFTAPRRQSLDRMRSQNDIIGEDIGALAYDFESSPRRYENSFAHSHRHRANTSYATTIENMAPKYSKDAPSSHHHHMKHPSCYHCHLLCTGNLERKSSSATAPPGPKLPRLQLSTSGLGFSDSEFEVPPDSPLRKVMLSENERKMINQQRELNLKRQWSQKSKHRSGDGDTDKEKVFEDLQAGYWAWKNVAAAPNAGPKQPEFGNRSSFAGPPGVAGESSKKNERGMARDRRSARPRSKTNPEGMGRRQAGHGRVSRSVDRTNRTMPVSRISIDGGPGQGLETHKSSRRDGRP